MVLSSLAARSHCIDAIIANAMLLKERASEIYDAGIKHLCETDGRAGTTAFFVGTGTYRSLDEAAGELFRTIDMVYGIIAEYELLV